MCTNHWFAKRYLVSLLGFVGLLVSVGFRTDFSLVMTHIAKYNKTNNHTTTSNNDFFMTCPVYNSPHDWSVDWGQDRIQLIHATYFAGSLITQVPGGILAARYSPKRLCGVMILISSVLFILLPRLAKVHWGFVFVVRGLQGLVESSDTWSPAYHPIDMESVHIWLVTALALLIIGGSVPAMSGVISAWAPKCERSRLLTIAFAGAYLSPAVGFISAGMATCVISWDSIFYIYGVLGVVWFVLWMTLVYETPDNCPCLSPEEEELFRQHGPNIRRGGSDVARAVPWRHLLTSLPVLAIFLGAFCRNWIFSMMITQQPQYFKDSFIMNTADIGLLSAAPPVLMTVVVIAGGVFFDKLITGDYITRTLGRKVAQTFGFGTEAVCVLCLYFVDDWKSAFSCLCIGVGFSGLAISGYQVNPLDLSPQYASIITGIGRVGTIGAILSTSVASHVLKTDHSVHQWKKLWLAAGVIHLFGVLLYDILASGNIQPWDPSQQGGQVVVVNVDESVEPRWSVQPQEYDPLLPREGRMTPKDRDSYEKSLEDSLILR